MVILGNLTFSYIHVDLIKFLRLFEFHSASQCSPWGNFNILGIGSLRSGKKKKMIKSVLHA